MANEKAPEITAEAALEEQLVSDPQQGQSQLESTDSQVDESSQESSQDQSDIPEKFRGMSLKDVIKAHSSLEEKLGEQGRELGYARREIEQFRNSVREYEASQKPKQMVDDILGDFDQLIEENPREGVKKVIGRVLEKMQSLPEQVEARNRSRAGQDYYLERYTNDQDWREMQPEMQALAQQFGHLLKPGWESSKEAFDVLYRLAREKNLDKYVEKARKSQKTTKTEKRQSFVEGAGASSTSKKDNFDDSLSLEEMEKLLGFANK